MAEKRDTWAGEADENSEDVEGHKFAPDDEKREKYAEPAEDEDGEVEAHKF
jgi:hypothetical protein